ncbi:MAG: hypothetical protein IKA63_05175, partial [Clostridia bacterium]|nr:hypothetical protein [Clostridia bacterium]
MTEHRLPVEYPVSLSREEYVRSQQLLSGGTGMRGGNRVFPLITAVMFVLLLGVDYKTSGRLDLSMTVLTALIVAVELVLAFVSPRLVRRQHEEAYDQTRFSGYSFDGTVRITASEISKSTPSGETVIRLADCFYVEAEDMMIFCGPNRRSIVIP